MAVSRLCSVDGCNNPTKGRGWCNAHYERWRRHGDPLAGRTPDGALARFFQETVLTYEGDECLIWPYGRTTAGYATMQRAYVHRLACEAANGPPPSPDSEAAHTCGKGSSGCVAKRHVTWKTHAENLADMNIHGTRTRGEGQWMSILTEDDVRQIRQLFGHMSQRAIADRYGIEQSSISRIKSGKHWGWLP